MTTLTITPESLTSTSHPSREQLEHWWAEMHADPEDLCVAFNDLMPTDLATFLRQDLLLVLIHHEEEIASAGWLHDVVRDAHGVIREGWIGGWVAKPFRRRLGIRCWRLGLEYFLAHGVVHIHSSINTANRASLLFNRRMMGFTVVGIFPQLSPYQGVPTDVYILTRCAEDSARAWQRAEELARRRWPERYAACCATTDSRISAAQELQLCAV
jgi:hypothetical protein